jgi:hypothetical protein
VRSLIAIALQFSFTAAAQVGPAPAPAAPLIASPSVDLGDQPAGSKPAHLFRLTNPGPATVLFKSASPEPGVTVKTMPAALAPGESGDVVIEAKPLTGFGEFAYGADFQLAPESAGPLRLEIHGRVLQYFVSDPPDLQLMVAASPGGDILRMLNLRRLDGQPFKILGVRWEAVPSNPELMTGRYDPQPVSGGWEGQVRVEKLKLPGLYYARLLIQTDHLRQPQVQINVLVKNLTPLVLFPSELHFFSPVSRARLQAGTGPQRRLYVRALPGVAPFQPGHAAASPAFIKTAWEKSTIEGESVLVVSLDGAAPVGPFSGVIKLAAATPEGGEATVTVEGEVVP